MLVNMPYIYIYIYIFILYTSQAATPGLTVSQVHCDSKVLSDDKCMRVGCFCFPTHKPSSGFKLCDVVALRR